MNTIQIIIVVLSSLFIFGFGYFCYRLAQEVRELNIYCEEDVVRK